MKVYCGGGEQFLLGRADVPDDGMPVFEVPLFGPSSVIRESYTIGTVTYLPSGGGMPLVERVVLLKDGQPPELLPGWQPLAS